MSLTDDVNVTLDDAAAQLEKKGLSPWLVIGAIVAIVAFVLGWRKVTSKKEDPIGSNASEPGA